MEEIEKKGPSVAEPLAVVEAPGGPAIAPAASPPEADLSIKLLQEIKAILEERLSYDATKEKAMDRLSEELKLYKDDFIFQSQKPLLIDLIMLLDGVERLLDSLESGQDRVREGLGNLKVELLEILYRRDVVPFDSHPETLDYKLHKTVKTVATTVETENNRVEKVLKPGFRWKDKVLRPEEVVILK